MKIYIARPINGCSPGAIVDYYAKMADFFGSLGLDVLQPMIGKGALRDEKEFSSSGYKIPCCTDHSILQRDTWMLAQADLVFVDLIRAVKPSIGCCMELAIGHYMRKHTIVIMVENGIHDHAFVRESADIIFPSTQQGMEYVEKLVESQKGKLIL